MARVHVLVSSRKSDDLVPEARICPEVNRRSYGRMIGKECIRIMAEKQFEIATEEGSVWNKLWYWTAVGTDLRLV